MMNELYLNALETMNNIVTELAMTEDFSDLCLGITTSDEWDNLIESITDFYYETYCTLELPTICRVVNLFLA